MPFMRHHLGPEAGSVGNDLRDRAAGVVPAGFVSHVSTEPRSTRAILFEELSSPISVSRFGAVTAMPVPGSRPIQLSI